MAVGTRRVEVLVETSQLDRLLGQAVETDVAQSVVTGHAVAVGQATETDVAQSLGGVPVNTAAPTVIGVVKVGHPVRALTGSWA